MPEKQEPLEQGVFAYISKHGLVSAGERLAVAVSGGADSVCLLHILAQRQRELGVELHAVHLNHQLRGAESDWDATYVSDLARHLDIPATIERRDVAAYRNQKGCSLEEAAREERYSFLAKVARATGAVKIVLGHTRDDQIETIMMHLLRGTGLAGLRGLQPRSLLQYGEDRGRMEIVRPLLEVTRQETSSYCWRSHLEPRSDSSNESLSFLRNRVRLELLPILKSYNPSIDKALLRLATVASDDVAFIEEQASGLWHEVAKEESGAIYLDVNRMTSLPRAMQKYIFRLSIAQLQGSLKDVEANHIEAMMNLLSRPSGKKLCLPQGLMLATEYGHLVLTSTQSSSCPLPSIENQFNINVPGETISPGWQVKADILQEAAYTSENGFTASLDLDKAGRELAVRQRKPGDSFQPLGMNQTKKLQDFMVDARIPRAWRDRVPLVCSREQILWVVGWRINDRVKVTEATKGTLRLKFERLD